MRILSAFLLFFFHHLYTTLAWSYDVVAWAVSVGQWRAWTRTVLEPPPRGPTLELGHGPGHLLMELSRLRVPFVGVDLSRQMGRIAMRRLRRAGAEPSIVRAAAQALPFPDAQFQSIVTTFPAEFALSPETLAEVWRVLGAGAALVMVLSAQITGQALLDRFAAWLFRITRQYVEVQAEWLDPLRQAGFEVDRQDRTLDRARVVRIIARKR